MNIRLILSPYDSGNYNQRAGAGTLRLMNDGLEQVLTTAGHRVIVETLQPDTNFRAEIATSFELQRLGADATHRAVADGAFPLLLSGNCNASVGPVMSAGAEGLIWFDAHGDFNTPETSPSGFLDGMPIAILAGLCWQPLAAKLPGFRPIQEANIVHVGGRDFDAAEFDLLRESAITLISPDEVRQSGIVPGLEALSTQARRVHIHFDLDALDPSVGRANGFAAPNGLSLAEAGDAIRAVRTRFTLASASISSYDPAGDPEGKIVRAAFEVIKAMTDDLA